MIFVYLVALFAGILWGITESVNKNITEKKFSSFSYFFIQVFANSLLYFIPFILYGSLVAPPAAYLLIIIPVICLFFANIFMIKAYKTEDISNLNILFRSSLPITFLSGIYLLHEKITVLNIFGVLSILLGILVIFYEGKKIKPTNGFLLALSAGILIGSVSYLRKLSFLYFNPITVVFLVHFILTILVLTIPRTYKDIKPIFLKYKKKIVYSRITAVIAFFLINWAFSKGNISIVNTNYEAAFLLSTSFIGIMLMGEKKNTGKKLTGSLLCILGIILLNFF